MFGRMLRFLTHGHSQVIVELRELLAVRRNRFQSAQLQPLAGEIFHQRMGLRILQHALNLGLQHLRLRSDCLSAQRSSSSSGMLDHRK